MQQKQDTQDIFSSLIISERPNRPQRWTRHCVAPPSTQVVTWCVPTIWH